MRDVQRRLGALRHDTSGDEAGHFGAATVAAVRAFQRDRGLRVTGTCDVDTWEALVEAGWRLGDRPLYLATTWLRGDDVAELQRRLGAIGFDAGRVDGIFGPGTDRALSEFQRNTGLVCDAVCGPATVAALARLGDRDLASHSVADVRERERLRRGPSSLSGRVVVLAHGGGLDALANAAARAVVGAGAEAFVLQHPDGSEQASQANTVDADVFLALALSEDDHTCRVAHYRAPGGWSSPGGRVLAERLQRAWSALLADAGAVDGGVVGMSVPVLRGTRMPAVVAELAPATGVVEHAAELAASLPAVLDAWVACFREDDAAAPSSART